MTTSDKVVKIAENEAKVFEKGRQAEYDAFWDAYQNHGAKQYYQYAFCDSGWNDETFKPKYDIVMGLGYSGTNAFWSCAVSNIAEALEKRGLILDTTLCGYASGMFQNAKTKRIPELNFTHAADYNAQYGLYYIFANSSVETIDKIIVVENLNYKYTFQGCDKLKNIVFEGTIGRNIDFQWSPLSRESIISVVYALSDSANGQTATFNRSAVNTAFETSEGAADGSTSAEWQELIATKSNWNISLV